MIIKNWYDQLENMVNELKAKHQAELAGMREAFASIAENYGHDEMSVHGSLSAYLRQLSNSAADAGVRAIEERISIQFQKERDIWKAAAKLSDDTIAAANQQIETIERRVLEKAAAALDEIKPPIGQYMNWNDTFKPLVKQAILALKDAK